MTPSDFNDAASRLCTACGMCCNGVLFHIVRLQPTDSPQSLEALGMKLSRRKREPYFKQPCRFLKNCECQIYVDRPLRCRLFECRQLKLLANEHIDEADARRVIDEVKSAVARVERLLEQAGDTSTDLPLFERCAQVLAQTTRDASTVAMQELLTEVVRLNDRLNADLRVVPSALATTAETTAENARSQADGEGS